MYFLALRNQDKNTPKPKEKSNNAGCSSDHQNHRAALQHGDRAFCSWDSILGGFLLFFLMLPYKPGCLPACSPVLEASLQLQGRQAILPAWLPLHFRLICMRHCHPAAFAYTPKFQTCTKCSRKTICLSSQKRLMAWILCKCLLLSVS